MMRRALLWLGALGAWSLAAALGFGAASALRAPAPPLIGPFVDAAQAFVEERAPRLPSMDAFDPIAARPLFTPSRRPPAAAATVAVAATPPAVMLLGVAGVGEDRVATLLTDEGATLRLVPGARIGDWTVARIEPRAMTLRAGEAEHVAHLGDRSPLEGGASVGPVRATPDDGASGAFPSGAAVRAGQPFFDPNPPGYDDFAHD